MKITEQSGEKFLRQIPRSALNEKRKGITKRPQHFPTEYASNLALKTEDVTIGSSSFKTQAFNQRKGKLGTQYGYEMLRNAKATAHSTLE